MSYNRLKLELVAGTPRGRSFRTDVYSGNVSTDNGISKNGVFSHNGSCLVHRLFVGWLQAEAPACWLYLKNNMVLILTNDHWTLPPLWHPLEFGSDLFTRSLHTCIMIDIYCYFAFVSVCFYVIILVEMRTLSFTIMRSKILSAKWRPFWPEED